jgi:hypothetical protein
MSDVLHIKKGARVRFDRQATDSGDGGEVWRVTQSLASRRPSIEGASASGRALVTFRMALAFRETLAVIARSTGRPMGVVIEHVLDHPRARIPATLPDEIVAERGRPSPYTEDDAFNCVVEIQETGQSFSTQLIGHWADQSVYLSPAHVQRIEAAAKASGLSADQALDAFIANHLAESLKAV